MFDFNFNGKQDAFDTFITFKSINGMNEQKDKDECNYEDNYDYDEDDDEDI